MKQLFLHGLGQTAASWESTLAALGAEVSPDSLCPQLTDWAPKGQVDYPALYRGLCGYIAPLSGPVDLCGLSLGGTLALQYALQHPGRVRSLALIGTQYTMPKGLLRFQNLLFGLMPGSAFAGMGFDKADAIRLCRSMMELDMAAELPKLRCPVLAVCGEKDRANRPAALRLKAQLPQAQLRLIPGAGHELNADAPKALAHTLSAFWSALPDAEGRNPGDL